MADSVIDDLNIDSPHSAPPRHYAFDEEGITDLLVDHGRPCERETQQRRCDRCDVVGRWGPDCRSTQVRHA